MNETELRHLADSWLAISERIKANPNDFKSLYFRSEVCMRVGLYENGREDAIKALQLAGDISQKMCSSGQICTSLISQLKLEEAKEQLEKLSSSIQSLPDSFKKDSNTMVSVLKMKLGEFKKQYSTLDVELPSYEDNDFVKRGKKLMEENKYAEAVQEYTKAIRFSPRDEYIYMLRAEAHTKVLNHAYLAFFDAYRFQKANHPILLARNKKIMAQALCLMGDFTFNTFTIAAASAKINPRDPSISKLLFSIFSKFATKEKPVIPMELTLTAVFSLPIVKNYSDAEEEQYLANVFGGNPLLEVKKIENMGRGVFATADIKANQVIHKEKPFLAADVRDNVCQTCFTELNGERVKCEKCEEEFYCSLKCKQEGWEAYHKGICSKGIRDLRKFVRENGISSSAKGVLLAAKCAGMISSSQRWVDLKSNPDFCGVPDLDEGKFLINSHKGYDLLINNMIVGIDQLGKATNLRNDPYFDLEWYVKLAGKIAHNSFTCMNTKRWSKIKGSAMVMYSAISLINHSCASNVLMEHFLPEGVLVAKRNIQKGEQLFLSYGGDPVNLSACYGFKCSCDKCKLIG